MPGFNATLAMAVAHAKNPHLRKVAQYLQGPPGCGKTAVAHALGAELGLPPERVVVWRPSLRNPVDLMGIPGEEDGLMHWRPPAELARLREGEWVLCIDELADCGPMMQNALCGALYDRVLGEITFSPDVHMIATGNRVEDRSGAQKIVSKLGNRVQVIDFEYNTNDWIEWAIDAGLDMTGIAYIKFKDSALFDFLPERLVNATPRSWESALRVDPTGMTPMQYLDTLSGYVTRGLAADYIAFRELEAEVPDMDEIRRSPATARMPSDTGALYVTVATLSVRTRTVDDFERTITYVERMPSEYQTLYVHGAIRQCTDAKHSPAYINWISNNAHFMGAGRSQAA